MDGLIYCIHSYAETAAVTQIKATTRLLRHNTPISLIKRNDIYPFPLLLTTKNSHRLPFIYNPLHKKRLMKVNKLILYHNIQNKYNCRLMSEYFHSDAFSTRSKENRKAEHSGGPRIFHSVSIKFSKKVHR